jgi:methionyl-tRNA formyltransferase
MKVGVLASGKLGYEVLTSVWATLNPSFVATDKNSKEIIDLANKSNIPLFTGNPRNGALTKFLDKLTVDAVFSINYLFILEKDAIARLNKIVNFHGSMLPKYRGRTPHIWAIINNEQYTGVTAHFVDEGCDTGPIILQEKIRIEPNDRGTDILIKFAAVYPALLLKVFDLLKSGEVIERHQDDSKATYFGKRTPDDGRINWYWQRERIYNWVRALSNPYPGAFTFLDGNKIVIDKISFHDGGFRSDDPDGLVKSISPFLVKTPNGLVQLDDIRTGMEFISINKILQ